MAKKDKAVAAEKAPKVTRAEKIASVVEGKTFTLKDPKPVDGAFSCICGGTGKHAYIVVSDSGEEIKVGTGCLKHVGIEVPKVARKATRGPKATKSTKKVKKDEASAVAPDDDLAFLDALSS